MITETMTVRKALQQKKLLDKQLETAMKGQFIEVSGHASRIIDGMTTSAWKDDALRRFQQVQDKMRRRDALQTAILQANVSNTVRIPKLVNWAGQEEGWVEVSFATAVARKNYYTDLLENIVPSLMSQVRDVTERYNRMKAEAAERVAQRVFEEFSNITNASPKQKAEREKELQEQYQVDWLDPVSLHSRVTAFKMALEDAILEIDSALGHATEVTELTVSY